MWYPSLSFITVLAWKSILSDMSITTQVFIHFHFAWYVSSLLSQLPCVYPFFWIEFLAFLIHSAIQCLLISNLNTFSFKVIINTYVLILIMLIVSGCFCSSSLFLLSYLSSFMVFWLALLLCLISLLIFFLYFTIFFMCGYYEVHI